MTRTRPPRLLIVDDATDVAEMWAYYFRSLAYDVLTAYTGLQALAAARLGHPDVILLDLQLPDLSGTDVAERLKRDPQTTNIPLIAVTGLSSAAAHDAARRAGMSSVVVKPCNPDDLLHQVEGAIGEADQRLA